MMEIGHNCDKIKTRWYLIMKIALACDHDGFRLKEQLKQYLIDLGHEVEDVGTFSTESCHYPIFSAKAANLVKDGVARFGIIVCTTGEGVAMAANKVKGIRAGVAYNNEVARLMREHNDANVMTLGARFTTLEEAKERIDIFLKSEFQGGRHAIRVQMINDLEK